MELKMIILFWLTSGRCLFVKYPALSTHQIYEVKIEMFPDFLTRVRNTPIYALACKMIKFINTTVEFTILLCKCRNGDFNVSSTNSPVGFGNDVWLT